MAIDWLLSLYSLIGAFTLLGVAYLTKKVERTVVAPATAMLLTWGIALFILSFLPTLGFYYVSAQAVVLYVLGAIWFAVVALVTGGLLKSYSRKKDGYRVSGIIQTINYNRLYLACIVIAFTTFPLAVLNILEYGSNITEISYNIRRASLDGESILNPVVNNLFVVMGAFLTVVLFGVITGRLKISQFILVSVPYVLLVLVISGRSGIVSLILGWLTIVVVFSVRLKARYIIMPMSLLLGVIYLGGVWVKKFETEGQSLSDTVVTLLEHIFGYLYQGPILFSRFFENDIDIATNWDFLTSACHVLSKLGICTPNLSKHADFASYSMYNMGNVYSIYFSIIPHYGILGLIVVFAVYGIFLGSLFHYFKKMSVFCLIVYPYMFSAILLSPFKDGIGYSVYWQIKILLICFLISLVFSKRFNKYRSNGNHYQKK